MKATCTWCLSIIDAPKHYDPLRQDLYCCKNCAEKDWLFKRWMNDNYLNYLVRKMKGEEK